jgi:hypothetical protein
VARGRIELAIKLLTESGYDVKKSVYVGPYTSKGEAGEIVRRVEAQQREIFELKSTLTRTETELRRVTHELRSAESRENSISKNLSELKTANRDLNSKIIRCKNVEVKCVSGEFVVRPRGSSYPGDFYHFYSGESWLPDFTLPVGAKSSKVVGREFD